MFNETSLGLIFAFAVGSIPFGWIIAKLWGISDLREVGSHNIGATNVVRTAGPIPGALTFLLDFAKGVVPVIYLAGPGPWIGFCAVLGHCFSPFLSFKGGKGVSTTLGAIVALNPWLGGACIVVYAGALAVTRVSALGSLFAMLTALAGTVIFSPHNEDKLAVGCMVAVVLARHRENWDKLLTMALTIAIMLGCLMPLAMGGEAQALKDFRGHAIATSLKPRRIAALIPSLAETVVDLGAADRLVAAPDYSRLPPKLGGIAKLGPYNRISAEAVYAAHPDLVLASMDGNDSTLVSQLEKLGLRVTTVNTQSLSDIFQSIEMVAAAVGNSGDKKVNELRDLLKHPRASGTGPRPRVFLQIGWEPLVTVSKNTFIDEIVRLNGAVTIFSDAPTKYPRPNPEEVIAKDPDVIIICRLTDNGTEAEQAREFWMRFKNIKAVKAGKIYIIPGDWLTKPNFALMKGIRELQRIL